MGNRAERIAPYRQIRQDDLYERKDHALLSKARYVIKCLIARCPLQSTYLDVSRKVQQELDAMFEIVYIKLCECIYPDTTLEKLDGRRVGDRSYLTIYDHSKKYNV